MQTPPPNPKRQRDLTVIYLCTAVVALALYRGAGLPIVVSFLLGFVIVAIVGLVVLRIASVRGGHGEPPNDG